MCLVAQQELLICLRFPWQVVYNLFGVGVWTTWERRYCTLKWLADDSGDVPAKEKGGEQPQQAAVLCTFKSSDTSRGAEHIYSLRRCFVCTPTAERRSPAASSDADGRLILLVPDLPKKKCRFRGAKVCLQAENAIVRDEWILCLRKYATSTRFSNGYVYEEVNALGKGGYGTVYTCFDRYTKKEWACKIIPKRLSQQNLQELETEVKLTMKVGSHANICFLKEFVETSSNFYLVSALSTTTRSPFPHPFLPTPHLPPLPPLPPLPLTSRLSSLPPSLLPH